jgi:hypothetical protein
MRSMMFLPGLVLGIWALAVPAHAAFKCKEDGKIVYQDAPCDGEGAKVDTSGGLNNQAGKTRTQRSRSRITREVAPPASAGSSPSLDAGAPAGAVPSKAQSKQ